MGRERNLNAYDLLTLDCKMAPPSILKWTRFKCVVKATWAQCCLRVCICMWEKLDLD